MLIHNYLLQASINILPAFAEVVLGSVSGALVVAGFAMLLDAAGE